MTRRSTLAQSKEAERHVAKELGARRLRAGEHRGEGDLDLDGGWFVVQVKHRKDVPAWLRDGMAQAMRGSCGLTEKPMPLLAIRTKPGSGRDAQTYIVVTAEHWIASNGRGQGDD